MLKTIKKIKKGVIPLFYFCVNEEEYEPRGQWLKCNLCDENDDE